MQCPSCNQACSFVDVEQFGMCDVCYKQVMNDQESWVDNFGDSGYDDDVEEFDDAEYNDDLVYNEIEQGFYDDDYNPYC